jgi:hypothetical protein
MHSLKAWASKQHSEAKLDPVYTRLRAVCLAAPQIHFDACAQALNMLWSRS